MFLPLSAFRCYQQIAEEENEEFREEYLSKRDPSILRFLLASGDDVSRRFCVLKESVTRTQMSGVPDEVDFFCLV